MAADDELPRGWKQAAFAPGTGVAAAITIPAIAGVCHVLDEIDASLICYAAFAGFSNPQVQVVSGAITFIAMMLLVQGTVGSEDSWQPSNLGIVAPPGAALTVQFSGVAAAGQLQRLTIGGHDI